MGESGANRGATVTLGRSAAEGGVGFMREEPVPREEATEPEQVFLTDRTDSGGHGSLHGPGREQISPRRTVQIDVITFTMEIERNKSSGGAGPAATNR